VRPAENVAPVAKELTEVIEPDAPALPEAFQELSLGRMIGGNSAGPHPLPLPGWAAGAENG